MSEESDKPAIEIVLADSLKFVTRTHMNVGQEVMITTEDKIKLCLKRHEEQHAARQAWLTPFGIVLTLLLALVTCNFQPRLGASGDTWHAAFIMGFILSSIWLVRALVKIRFKKPHTIEDVVDELKQNQPEQYVAVSRN